MSDKHGHSDPNEHNRDKYQRHIDGSITVRGQIETHLPPNATEKHDAERIEDTTQAKKTYIVGLLTLIFVIIYAGLTFWQDLLTKESVKQAKESFQIQYRPWVNAQKVFPTVDVGVGEVPISVEIGNAGNSPSLHTVTYLEASPMFCLADAKFNDHPHYSQQRARPSSAMLLPNTGGVIDPYRVTIAANVWSLLQRGDCVLYAYGTVTYCDVFGHLHWQHFCANWIRGTPRQFNACYGYGDGDQDYPDAPLRSCPKEPPATPPEVP